MTPQKLMAPKLGAIDHLHPCLEQNQDAITYLLIAEPAIAGRAGHSTTFAVACWLRKGFGLEEEEIFRLMLEHYSPRCCPPWSAAELRHKAKDACARIQTREDRTWCEPRHLHSSKPASPSKAEQRTGWGSYVSWLKSASKARRACRDLAKMRYIPEIASFAAWSAGTLRFGKYKHGIHGTLPFWALVSSDLRMAEIRRMDGQLWPQGCKALKLKGSEGAIVGEQLIGSHNQHVYLAEGGPDYLAALWLSCLAHAEGGGPLWAALGILGASNHFHQLLHRRALERLRGRKVRIFVHDDGAARGAAKTWAGQLKGVGCQIEALHMGSLGLCQGNGDPISDLNDALRMPDAELETFVREVLL